MPICGPSSGCDLTFGVAIQDVWGVLLGYWGLGGGNEVLHNTVEHNYISSSSTLGLQLHVSALYVGHLQIVT